MTWCVGARFSSERAFHHHRCCTTEEMCLLDNEPPRRHSSWTLSVMGSDETTTLVYVVQRHRFLGKHLGCRSGMLSLNSQGTTRKWRQRHSRYKATVPLLAYSGLNLACTSLLQATGLKTFSKITGGTSFVRKCSGNTQPVKLKHRQTHPVRYFTHV